MITHKPFGENFTLEIFYECPFKGSPIFSPVYASQIIANVSWLPVTICVPSGEKLTLLIPKEWPYKGSPKMHPKS